MILIYITCPNKKEAQKIGRTLIREHLAGCVNIFPIESIYLWPSSASTSVKTTEDKKATEDKKKKITEDKEIVLIAKTLKKNFKKVEERVKKIHSYKTPCILGIPVTNVSKDYLKWVEGEVSH